MKKFHWGHGIFIFFVFYVGILMIAVFKSRQIDHSLVVDEYYKQDLAYQAHYDKLMNAGNAKKDFEISADENGKHLIIFNDGDEKQGSITFYNPSNKSKDLVLPLNGEHGNDIMIIHEILSPGKWKVQADWVALGTAYFVEKEIYITAL